jgi:hypothetical protein
MRLGDPAGRVVEFGPGPAEDLRVGLGGQQPRHAEAFLPRFAAEDRGAALRCGFPFGRAGRKRQVAPPDERGGQFPVANSNELRARFPTCFSAAHPPFDSRL